MSVSKRVIQKTAVGIGDFIENPVAEKIVS